MTLAKQKSGGAEDGCLDPLPRRLRERTFDRGRARREFRLPTREGIALPQTRVFGIRHMNRNF